jgi:GNAT superfamily N-acetyltransferase
VITVGLQSNTSTIRDAKPADLESVRDVLVEAFLYGDLGPWLIPHLDTRHRIYVPYFEMLAEHAIEHATVDITTGAPAVAIWYTVAEGHQPAVRDCDARLTEITGRFRGRFVELDRAMAQHHPRKPLHDYLAFLAVHPEHQRQGLGSRLLRHHHGELDRSGTPAFLEATGTLNRRLYTRHGYAPLPTYRLNPGGPQLYPLWRPARSQSAAGLP